MQDILAPKGWCLKIETVTRNKGIPSFHWSKTRMTVPITSLGEIWLEKLMICSDRVSSNKSAQYVYDYKYKVQNIYRMISVSICYDTVVQWTVSSKWNKCSKLIQCARMAVEATGLTHNPPLFLIILWSVRASKSGLMQVWWLLHTT